jgi:hypothetical protein
MNGERELLVVECLPFDEEPPGFALPLLAHPRNPELRLVQEIDEYWDVVSAFKVLEGSNSNGIPVVEKRVAVLGGPTVYGFQTTDGVLHVGTLDELRPVLMEFTEAAQHPSIVLQIGELLGDTKQKVQARLKVFELIRSHTGAGSARAFYEGSALRSALWERILKLAPSADAAHRILRVRSKLNATFEGDEVRLDLSALAPEDREIIDEHKLIADLEAEFGTSSQDHTLDEIPFVDPIQVGRVADIVRQVERTGRQEERLAIILAAILNDRNEGMSVLRQHQSERAKFANWAFREVNFRLTRLRESKEHPNDEQIIAELVPIFFTKHYPLSRGELLFFLAKHLGSSPLINAAIQRSLDRTKSMFVDFHREQIQDQLAQGRRKVIRRAQMR